MNKRRIIQKQQQQRRKQGKQAASTSPNRMPWIIGGVVVAAIAIVGLLIWLNNRPTAAPRAGSGAYAQAEGSALGAAGAPVTMRLYSDFQCPFCKLFHNSIQQQIIDEYVSTGKARFEFHHFIVIDRNVGGNESRRAAEASECASEQGSFWDYQDILFANQQAEGAGNFSDDRLQAYAAELGLDTTRFNTCLSENRYAGKVRLDEAQAISLNLGGTPALFVGGTLVQNPLDWGEVSAAFEAALAAKDQ